ncbi:hypothetical protein EV182_005676 [Spiromyces aspiralis]|uniref:Uncharacterized protein n=1 Tax=Spiromyces aspiralis TaxID=68401 RepID=A0ACC1HNS2_9FUNG|nr:hypothetical protein EV182_005676 [Spiromyces aspiralis]
MSGNIGPQPPSEITERLGLTKAHDEAHLTISASTQDGHDDNDADAFAPALPPDMLEERRSKSSTSHSSARVGPTLSASTEGVMYPISSNPAGGDGDDENHLIGPSVSLAAYSNKDAQDQAVEQFVATQHKADVKDAGLDTPAVNDLSTRGEWMLVPPEPRAISGSKGAFEQTTSLGLVFDRSWTETPTERQERLEKQAREALEKHEKGLDIEYIEQKSKQGGEREAKLHRMSEADQEKAQFISEYNNRERPKSLLEEHQERISNKRGASRRKGDRGSKRRDRSASPRRGRETKRHDRDSDDEWERRRFNRDRDLAVGRVDSQRQRKLLSETGYLGNKFSHGRGGTFL